MSTPKTKTPTTTSIHIPGWWPAAARAEGTSITALAKGLDPVAALQFVPETVCLPGVLDQDTLTLPRCEALTEALVEGLGYASVAAALRNALCSYYPMICTITPAPGVVRLVLVDREAKAVRVAWVPLTVATGGAKAVRAYLRKERQIDVHGFKITEAEAPVPGQVFEGIRLSKSAWASKGKGTGK